MFIDIYSLSFNILHVLGDENCMNHQQWLYGCTWSGAILSAKGRQQMEKGWGLPADRRCPMDDLSDMVIFKVGKSWSMDMFFQFVMWHIAKCIQRLTPKNANRDSHVEWPPLEPKHQESKHVWHVRKHRPKSLLCVDDLGLAMDNIQTHYGKMNRIWGDARWKRAMVLVRLMKVMKWH